LSVLGATGTKDSACRTSAPRCRSQMTGWCRGAGPLPSGRTLAFWASTPIAVSHYVRLSPSGARCINRCRDTAGRLPILRQATGGSVLRFPLSADPLHLRFTHARARGADASFNALACIHYKNRTHLDLFPKALAGVCCRSVCCRSAPGQTASGSVP
jgi:hypothetical protein